MSFNKSVQYEIDNLKADLGKKLNLVPIRAVLGDASGVLYDPLNPNSGYVYIRQRTSNGLSTAQKVRGPYQGSGVQMTPGAAVIVKWDADGQLFVASPDFQATLSAGQNPVQSNAGDANSNGWTNQSGIVTLVSHCTAPFSTSVVVRGWMPITLSPLTITQFPGAQVDLSGFIPTAGNQCLACIFLMADLATIEVKASTTKPATDVITVADIQECLSAATVGDKPIWAWRLHDAQTTIIDADSWLDLRQFLNLESSGEIKLSTTTGVDMNTATPTALYTVPTGRSCVITRVVVRNASTSLTTASYSFGFNSATFNDVIANATHTELTTSTLNTVLIAKAGSKTGAAADTFKVLMNTLQGGAATTTMDVFGYLL